MRTLTMCMVEPATRREWVPSAKRLPLPNAWIVWIPADGGREVLGKFLVPPVGQPFWKIDGGEAINYTPLFWSYLG